MYLGTKKFFFKKKTKKKKLDGRCCARHLLGVQPDLQVNEAFCNKKLRNVDTWWLTTLIKYHPELITYIEYFWGFCKRFARENCNCTLLGLRRTVPMSLISAVPMETIPRFFEKSQPIVDAYRDGYVYGTKEFTEKAYKSHRRAG